MESLTIKGIFNPKEILLKKNVMEWPVFWEYLGETVNVTDKEALERLENRLLEKQDWPALKVLNKIRLEVDVSKRKSSITSYPINIQVEHTNKCNARCIMCSHCFTRNHNATSMDSEDLEVLKDILPYVEHVTLHGNGEPFLHPNIIDILKIYDHYGIKVTCNTNCSIMSDELAEMVHKCFYDIAISCDACTKETYEKIRPGLDFDVFKKNVRLLRSKGDGLHMRLSAVAMRQNLEELPGIVSMASELGFQEVLIVDITTQGLLENAGDALPLYPALAKHYLSLAVKEGERLGIPVKIPDYIMGISTAESLEEERKRACAFDMYKEPVFYEKLYNRYRDSGFVEPKIKATKENFLLASQFRCEGICDFVLERPYIDSKGDVFLCCTNWMHSVGNIYSDGGFEAVWNGPIMQGIRDIFYSGFVPKYCVGCIFLRDSMMTKRIKVRDLTENFYKHNYDEQVSRLIEGLG